MANKLKYTNNFLYCDEVINDINNMKMNNNVLFDYDNVTYHCDLFTYSRKTQKEIDKNLLENGIYNPNKDKRIYICKDGVSTKFVIDSFTIKSKYGNHLNQINVASYEINLRIKETFSCLFSHELDVLGVLSGYESYLNAPYWLEIWFSGYNKENGMPVERIPLPNGEDSIIYEGYMSKCDSHIESSGTTWNIIFYPNYASLTNKSTNLLNIPILMKNSKGVKFNEFLKNCINQMFDRYLDQLAEKDDKGGRALIKSFYNTNKKDNKDPGTPDINSNENTNEDNKNNEYFTNIQNDFIKINIKDKDGNPFNDVNKIVSNQDTSKNDAEKNSEEQIADKTKLFTTICQEFLFNCNNYESYIVKMDIKSSIKGYYKNNPLLYHNIDLYLIEDFYILYKLKAYKAKQDPYKYKLSDTQVSNFVKECIGNGTLVKKYQYGFSGEDTSILEIDNKYDKLYYMNALPQSGTEWINSNVQLANQIINTLQENSNNSTEIIKISSNQDETQNLLVEYNGELLENLYVNMNKDNIGEAVAKYNKIPVRNDDLSNDNRRISTNSNIKNNQASVASGILYRNMYESGQLCTTQFTILGDPYWIATNAFKTKKSSNNSDISTDELPQKISANIPDYRCVFILKSSPEQNNFYSEENSTDYTFENALYASGIYIVTGSESIFEAGKFIQKIKGQIDIRLIKEL